MELILAYPAWYLILCVLIAGAFSWFLYYRERSLVDVPPWLLNSLRVLRFLAILLISFLLLEPMLSFMKIELRKPILIYLEDNSRSLLMSNDSAALSKELSSFRSQLESKVESEFDFYSYQFGEELSLGLTNTYTDRSTNLNKALQELFIQHGSSASGLLLLASDGLLNEGRDPFYLDHRIALPVYSLGLGDTSLKSDLQLVELRTNDIAYLGNQFPLEYTIKAENLAGVQSRISVFEGEKELYTENIQIKDKLETISKRVLLEADEVGVKRFTVKLQPVEGEWTATNNNSEFSVEVIDSRAKIMIVSQSYHPDIAAIKESLNQSDDFEAYQKTLEGFQKMSDESIKNNFNLLIFHGLPGSSKQEIQRIQSLVDQKIPVFMVLTPESNIAAFNQLKLGMQIGNASIGQFNEVSAMPEENFSLFRYELDESWKNGLPPLRSPFGEYRMAGGVEMLLTQKLGQMSTGFPLLYFSANTNMKKFGVLVGEGIWRWKIFDFRKNQDHKSFNELIGSMCRYLASNEDRGRFRVEYQKRYYQGDKMKIEAELYNPSFQLTTEVEIELELENERGEQFKYQLSPTNDHYELELEGLKSGAYTFRLSTEYGSETFAKEGQFVVVEKVLEFAQNKADHSWLNKFSKKTEGNYYHWDDREAMIDALTQMDIKPESNSRRKLQLLIDFPWLLLLLLLPFSLEWFLRRRYGSY